jgi:hypothetical protein
LDEVLGGSRHAVYLETLLPPENRGASPPSPPSLDEIGLLPSDYQALARVAGVPSNVTLTTLKDFRAAVNTYMPPGMTQVFNVALKQAAKNNKRSRRRLERDAELYEHNTRRHRLVSMSAVVDALLRLGLDTLEEKVTARGTQKEQRVAKRSSHRNAGQVKNQPANRTSRQAVAA